MTSAGDGGNCELARDFERYSGKMLNCRWA